jgi:hypothetical protein
VSDFLDRCGDVAGVLNVQANMGANIALRFFGTASSSGEN